MPTNIECTSCGSILLAFASLGPRPIGGDDCPVCDGTEFEYVEI